VKTLTLPRLLAVIATLAVFAMAFRAPVDTDTYWHLRAGQWQVENHAILQVDVFSHTRAGSAWVNHSWLSQVILYAAFAVLGDFGLALYTALLATAGMAFIYACTKGAGPLVRAAAIVAAAATAAVFWSARPQMMSFLLSAVVYWLLWRWREEGKDWLWALPPVMALWANLHGGFAIGFVLMVLALMGETARWLFDGVLHRGQADPDASAAFPRLVRLGIVGLVSAAAISLNPYGPAMLLYPFRTVGIGVLRDFIQEWASPDFHQTNLLPFLFLLLTTLGAAGLSRRRLDWSDAALVIGTAASALLAGRNIAVFAITAAPVWARHVDSWLAEHGYKLRWGEGKLALNWALAALVGALVVLRVASELNPATVEAARAATLPVEAVDCMVREDPPGPLFNSYNWGGYLIWTARDYPVYVDGRTDLYDDELLRGYLRTAYAQEGWEEGLSGINVVLIERSSPLARVLEMTADWHVLCQDDVAMVFVRNEPLALSHRGCHDITCP
jgi:hypothetical protein